MTFLKFDELDVDLLAEEEDELANSLDTDFLAQNFLGNVLDQLNLQLALQMRSEFEKQKTSGDIKLGKDATTGIINLRRRSSVVLASEKQQVEV